MALTDSFPTQDPDGLSINDTRRVMSGLIARNADGTPRAGVLTVPSSPLVTGTGAMAYDIAPFVAATSRIAGGVELVANDAKHTVPTTAAPPSNSRIDVIWVRAQFLQNADGSNLPAFGVAQGAAAAIPLKPSIPAGALELGAAEITSLTTTTATAVITPTVLFTAAAGGIVPVRNATQLAAYQAAEGTTARNLETGALSYRSGGAWVDDTSDDTGWVNVSSFGPSWAAAGGLAPQVRRVGKLVTLDGAVQISVGGQWTDILRIPNGFGLTGSRNRFVGATVSNGDGAARAMLYLNAAGVLHVPTGYRIGALSAGQLLPVRGSWYRD